MSGSRNYIKKRLCFGTRDTLSQYNYCFTIKMQQKDLDARFEEAVAIANTMTQAELPQDIQLRLYAYYKQATKGTISNEAPMFDIRNAFKTNAWMQISHLSIDEAKELYIKYIMELHHKKINQ